MSRTRNPGGKHGKASSFLKSSEVVFLATVHPPFQRRTPFQLAPVARVTR